MSKYTPIIENSIPVAHYNCNDLSGDIVDNVNSLDFIDSGVLIYQQDGALVGEPLNKSISLNGAINTPATLDTSTFNAEFSTEFFINQGKFNLKIGNSFQFNVDPSGIMSNDLDWGQRGTILQASDAADNDYFGSSCSLSNDGNILVVGAYAHETTGTDTGAVYTYDRSGDTWIQRGLILQASDAANSDQFGRSCSLSNDGNILVVGAWAHETTGTDTGAVYTYDRSGDTWIQRGTILQASDAANYDYFGYSCGLSNDGNILVVGAFAHETTGTDTGAVYTYDRSGDTWIQRGLILQASDAANYDYFGTSCGLSDDGNILVVGANAHETTGTDTGAVYTYDRSGDTWVQRGTILQASDAANSDNFGSSCSLSDDGNILIVGAHAHETTGTNTGAVYTYDRSGDTWIQRGLILQASDAADSDYFGISCSLSNGGNALVVGAFTHDNPGTNTGAMYTYDISSIGKQLQLTGFNHIVLNYKDNLLKIYSNGGFVYSWFYSPTFNSLSDIKILTYSGLDELIIYDRTLSEYEISSHYNNSKQFDGVETNILNSVPMFYFPMDDSQSIMTPNIGYGGGVYLNNPVYQNTNSKLGKSVLFDGINQKAVINMNSNEYDEYFDNVELLLQFNGNEISDNSERNQAIIKNTGLSITNTPEIFGYSGYASPTNDTRITSNGLILGGDFTIELTFKVTDYTSGYRLLLHIEDGIILQRVGIRSGNLGFNDRIQFSMYGFTTLQDAYSINKTFAQLAGEPTHIALIRNNGECSIYLNGVLQPLAVGTSTSYLITSFTDNSIIYCDHISIASDLDGVVDDIRISNGVARYTQDFIPPNKPFKLGKSKIFDINNDSDYNKVSLLLHMDGIDGSNNFIDSSLYKHPITTNGITTISTTPAKFGQSAHFNGSGDYLEIPYSKALAFDDLDFTLEFWVYRVGDHQQLARYFTTLGNDSYSGLYVISDGLTNSNTMDVSMSSNGSAFDIGTLSITSTIELNTWYHIALTRIGNDFKLFVNGVEEATLSSALPLYDSNAPLTIGGQSGTSRSINGHIDEFRITKGLARYTGNFIPPTKQFFEGSLIDGKLRHSDYDPYYKNTSLLMHMGGLDNSTVFTDSSPTNNTITRVGNTYISTLQAKFGQSAYFDGVTDYLTVPYDTSNSITSGDFTIECWIYRTEAISGDMVSRRNDSTGTAYWLVRINTDGSILFINNQATIDITSINIAPLFTWTHISITRLDGISKIYVNGVNNDTVVSNSTANIAEQLIPLAIGNGEAAIIANPFKGYIDEFRITKGVARYISDFTPQTKLFYDSNPEELQLLSVGTEVGISIECWFNCVSVNGGSYNTIFSKGSELENALTIQDSAFSTTGDISYYYSDIALQFNTALGLNTWNHIVITQTTNTTKMYLNGIEVANVSDSSYLSDKDFYIASDELDVYPSNIYVDGFIVSDRIFEASEVLKRYDSYEGNSFEPDYYVDINATNPTMYFKLDDQIGSCLDEISGEHHLLSNSYILKQPSLLLADNLNKSIIFTDATLTFPNVTSPDISVSFYFNLSAYPSGSNMELCQGNTTIAYIQLNTNLLNAWNGSTVASSGFTPQLNTTYHLTITTSQTEVTWYINGSIFATNTIATNLAYVNEVLGKNINYDEFLIHNRILSATEVANIYQASNSLKYTKNSYSRLVESVLIPKHYYKLNDITTDIIDTVSGYNGVISGNTYIQGNNSLLQSDVGNASTNLQDAFITFDDSTSIGPSRTISFIMEVNSATSGNIIYQTGLGGLIIDTFGDIRFTNDITESNILFSPEIGKSYNYALTIDSQTLMLYINGELVGVDSLQTTITGFDTISQANCDISLDEFSIFDKVLTELEIIELYNKATYDIEDSIAYHITGVTQVIGINTVIDLRLFHHDTGGLITQIQSNVDGTYEFKGLYEGLKYDVIAWQESEVTTCQHVNMGVLPTPYNY